MKIRRRGAPVKTIKLTPCPTCGQPMTPQLTAMVRQNEQGKTKPRWQRTRSTRFESSVAALPFNPNGFSPSEPEPAPEFAGVLSPGEQRSSKVYHQWSVDDIWVSGLLSVVSGSLVGLSAIPVCMAAQASWYWVPISWLGATTAVWFVKSRDFFDNDKAIVSVQHQERRADPAPIIHESPTTEIVIQDGKTQRRARLHAPQADHGGLWQYADALLRETAAPSYEGGKEVLGAKAFGYTPAEFDGREDAWRPTAITGGILESDPHKSKGYRLTANGRRALAVIAKRRLGEWG